LSVGIEVVGTIVTLVEQTGNIGTKNEPCEATFKCIKKVPISDKV